MSNRDCVKSVFLFTTGGLLVTRVDLTEVVPEEDQYLISGLFTAIKCFINTVEGKELETIRTTDSLYMFLPSALNKIIFGMITNPSYDEGRGIQILEEIRDRIIEEYHDMVSHDWVVLEPDARENIRKVIKGVLLFSQRDRFCNPKA